MKLYFDKCVLISVCDGKMLSNKYSHWVTYTQVRNVNIVLSKNCGGVGVVVGAHEQRVLLNTPVELRYGCGILISSKDTIPIHKGMPIVKVEEFVVNVMVRGCSEAQLTEEWIPRMTVFCMDQCEPVRIQRTKCHIRPNIGINKSRSDHERN